jgi:hypothetical protein
VTAPARAIKRRLPVGTDMAALFDVEMDLAEAPPQVDAIDAPPHAIALTMPSMPHMEYRALVEDIATHGQRDPITLFEGAVLDGVHRQRACRDIGVPVRFTVFEGSFADAVAFVVSKNVLRRHLTESQRALVGAKLTNLTAEAARGGRPGKTSPQGDVSRTEAAQLVGVSPNTLTRARTVLRAGDADVVAAVERGELTVAAAVDAIRGAGPDEDVEKITASLEATVSVDGRRVTLRGSHGFGRILDALAALADRSRDGFVSVIAGANAVTFDAQLFEPIDAVAAASFVTAFKPSALKAALGYLGTARPAQRRPKPKRAKKRRPGVGIRGTRPPRRKGKRSRTWEYR